MFQLDKICRRAAVLGFIAALVLAPAGCGGEPDDHDHDHGADAAHGHDHAHGAEHGDEAEEHGPHGGRLLTDGDFSLEITIFEAGRPPQFRLYAYHDGEAVPPGEVTVTVTLSRLGGRVDRFSFAPQQDYLAGEGVVREPHSFDVAVTASWRGRRHEWRYESHEGRTVISDEAAREAGVTTEAAGPATLIETVDVLGRVDFAPDARATLRARFPGKVQEVFRTVGDTVKAGDLLALVESNESLQVYPVTAPLDGVILERNANRGDVTGSDPLFRIGDPARLQVDFHVFASDLARVRPQQEVVVQTTDGRTGAKTRIAAFLPTKEAATQTVIARAPLPNPEGKWVPGTTVRGAITVAETPVPLAVRTQALQRFRNFTVVFAKYGEVYEVRMLTLGRQTREWTEILDGIEPGEIYVTGNSFLIKADIEKSGAAHEH